MTLVHEQVFRVRWYECDPYGHLNNTNYARYMQEAAFEASAAAGYPITRYEGMGHIWLARRSEIEYLQPVGINESVTVRTWVQGNSKVLSRRAYEFRQTETDTLIARAHTDWVYLDRKLGTPVRIPLEVAQAYFSEGVSPPTMRLERVPQAPPAPEGTFVQRRNVEWRDLDPEGHVNNAVYLAYAEHCGFHVLAAHGWPAVRCAEAGFVIFVRRHQIEYHEPAHFDDELAVSTWASEARRATAIRHYLIRRLSDGKKIARVRSLYVWLDAQTLEPIRIPEAFLVDFESNFTP